MRSVTTLHLLLLIFVHLVHRKHRKHTGSEIKPDAVRDAINEHTGNNLTIHPLVPYLLVLIPVYMMITNNARLVEHVFVMFAWFATIRSLQIVLNRETRPMTEYTAPIVVMSMLSLIFNNYIPMTQLSVAYLFMAAYAAVALMAYPTKTTSSSIGDDFILSHLMFYILK